MSKIFPTDLSILMGVLSLQSTKKNIVKYAIMVCAGAVSWVLTTWLASD